MWQCGSGQLIWCFVRYRVRDGMGWGGVVCEVLVLVQWLIPFQVVLVQWCPEHQHLLLPHLSSISIPTLPADFNHSFFYFCPL